MSIRSSSKSTRYPWEPTAPLTRPYSAAWTKYSQFGAGTWRLEPGEREPVAVDDDDHAPLDRIGDGGPQPLWQPGRHGREPVSPDVGIAPVGAGGPGPVEHERLEGAHGLHGSCRRGGDPRPSIQRRATLAGRGSVIGPETEAEGGRGCSAPLRLGARSRRAGGGGGFPNPVPALRGAGGVALLGSGLA